jgi:hypothetical protein
MVDIEARSLAFLRRNDPRETMAVVRLNDLSDDILLSEAFNANEHVNKLVLCVDGRLTAPNWNSLLHVIASRENLEQVCLDLLFLSRGTNPPVISLTPFLLAIQQNPRVHDVQFYDLQLSGNAFASFLDTATSVRTLKLLNCGMEAPGGVHAIAAALQRNTNIERLQLQVQNEMDLNTILSSLAYNTSVRDVNFYFPLQSLAVSLVVGRFLKSSTTIQRFTSHMLNFRDGAESFRPIAHGLIQSKNVTDVKLSPCWFNSPEDVNLLNSILQSKSNLLSLTLNGCEVNLSLHQQFHAAIFSALQPHSLLRSFELCSDWGLRSSRSELAGSMRALNFGAMDFVAIFTAVEASNLERFSVGFIDSRECGLALIASIPKMQVRTLEFNLGRDLEYMKGDAIQAVKRNSSLRTVVAKSNSSERWLNNDDRKTLTSYTSRNKFIAEWIENPFAVPWAVWPEALDVVQTIGPATVFRLLRVTLAPFLTLAEVE